MAIIRVKRSDSAPETPTLLGGELAVTTGVLYYGRKNASNDAEALPAVGLAALNLVDNIFTNKSSFKSDGQTVSWQNNAGTEMYGVYAGRLVAMHPSGFEFNFNDLVDKAYVDAVAQGLSVKLSVKAATTANLATFPPSGTIAVDGITVNPGDRVLVKNQTNESQNGVYLVASPWVRTTDMDAWGEVYKAYVFVDQGTAHGNQGWVTTVGSTGTIGTTPITWTQFNSVTGINVDEVTITRNSSNIISVKDGGINNTQIGASAAIAFSKLANGSAYSVLGVAGGSAASNASIESPINTVLRRLASGNLGFGKIDGNHIDSSSNITANTLTSTNSTTIGSGTNTWYLDGTGSNFRFYNSSGFYAELSSFSANQSIAYLNDIRLEPWHGTSTTAVATPAKTTTITNFVLKMGAIVNIIFTNGNTSAGATLSVNSGANIPIHYNGAAVTAGNFTLEAETPVLMYYDGTNFDVISIGGGGSGGFKFYTGSTSTVISTAAKVAAITGYTLKVGNVINVTFTTGNSVATATLNIESTGAKNITIGGSNVTTSNFTLGLNTIVQLYYTGTTYEVISIIAGGVNASTATGSIRYNGTTRLAGNFYGGTTAPSATGNRLNYDGIFYATQFEGVIDGGTTWS